MRPPICDICLASCGMDGLVYFRKEASDEEWDRLSQTGGFTGHPPYAGWFCPEHLAAAKSLEHLTYSEALKKISR